MPYLEFDGTTQELPRGETVIGSGSQAAWRVQDAGLAARHFTITVDPQTAAVALAPLSTQGIVVVNNRQVGMTGMPLRDGDRISAGAASFVYHAQAGRPAVPTPSEESAPQAFLVDEADRVAYPVRKRTTSVGRDAASHVVVRDPTVSRFHADVRAEAGQHVLYSMGSGGTVINGEEVTAPRVLADGDEIAVGKLTLRYTREPLPAALRVELGGGELDTTASVRPTLVMQEAITMERPVVRAGKRVPRAAILGGVALLVALVVLLVVVLT